MTNKRAREVVDKYIAEHGEIPSVFDDLKLAEAILKLGFDEVERIIKEL